MTSRIFRRGARSEAGSALVELAVALPLLVLVLLGTTDFARVFYTAIELTNAARAGAQYGASSLVRSDPAYSPSMQTTAVAAVNITGVTATATRTCACAPDNGASFTAVACTTTCAAGQHLVVHVTVTAAKTFSTIAAFPGIPSSIALTRTATMPLAN